MCDPVIQDLDGCDAEIFSEQENDLRMVLIDGNSLQGVFSDRCHVARIVGDVFWWNQFAIESADPAIQALAGFRLDSWQMMIGLRKDEVSTSQPEGNTYDPVTDAYDFSEGQWMKTWQKASLGRSMLSTTMTDWSNMKFPIFGVNVHTVTGACNTFVDGTGCIEIATDGETSCVNCENGDVQSNSQQVYTPTLHHFHIDHKRRISLRENEQLMLQFGQVFPLLDSGTSQFEPQTNWFGAIKTLVEV